MSVNDDDKRLPLNYWLPKLHKTPIKARFIIAAPKCSTKPLSKAITAVFKLMFAQIKAYNKEYSFYSGINTFWTILNNQPVINTINNLNERKKANSVTCFDFSTLYTKIPHAKLLKVLNELIDFCFKGGDKEYISVDRYGAKWVSQEKRGCVMFTKTSLKKSVKYLLDNCFFSLRK